MEEQPSTAANNLWAELRQWMKNNGLAQNLTVSEISVNELQIRTRQGHQLSLNFLPSAHGSLEYKLGASIGEVVPLSVTIRGAAFFNLGGKRHSVEELGERLLYELVSERT